MLIEDVASEIEGIKSCVVDFNTGRTEIEHDDSIDLNKFKTEVESLIDYQIQL